MWLRAARSRVLVRGVAALLAVLVSAGTLEWGHAGGDDRDCGVVAAFHDHDAHRLSDAQPAQSPSNDHCYICHSLRLLHAALVASQDRPAAGVRGTQFHDADTGVARHAFRLDVPSRAPPAVRL
jgi:hypothetical protein